MDLISSVDLKFVVIAIQFQTFTQSFVAASLSFKIPYLAAAPKDKKIRIKLPK